MSKVIENHRELLFPVRRVAVYAELQEGVASSRRRIPRQRAIVDCTNERVISLVSSDYRVVTNREALAYAHQCCESLFPEVPKDAWQVHRAEAPPSHGHCHMDLLHPSAKLDVRREAPGLQSDSYAPFVRVTNSYNRTRSLAFRVGFLRAVCSNGMILPSVSVRFSFNHNTKAVSQKIRAELSKERYIKLREQFLGFLGPLQQCEIGSEHFTPIALLALGIKRPEDRSGRDAERWNLLERHIDELGEQYAGEVGANGYALMNVVSDLASRPPAAIAMRRESHSLQRAAGAWLPGFSTRCAKGSIDPHSYAKELQAALEQHAPAPTRFGDGGGWI